MSWRLREWTTWVMSEEGGESRETKRNEGEEKRDKASRLNFEMSDAVLEVAGERMFGGCDWLLPLNPAPGLRWTRSM